MSASGEPRPQTKVGRRSSCPQAEEGGHQTAVSCLLLEQGSAAASPLQPPAAEQVEGGCAPSPPRPISGPSHLPSQRGTTRLACQAAVDRPTDRPLGSAPHRPACRRPLGVTVAPPFAMSNTCCCCALPVLAPIRRGGASGKQLCFPPPPPPKPAKLCPTAAWCRACPLGRIPEQTAALPRPSTTVRPGAGAARLASASSVRPSGREGE